MDISKRAGALESKVTERPLDLIRYFAEARIGALLVTAWAVWGLAFALGEEIPVNQGLGWDGVRFSKMVEGGAAMLPAKEINRYYVQRVGPSFAVRALLDMAGIPLEAASIRAGFVAWNLALLSAALALLQDAARLMSFSASGRWVLFLGLFANQANGRLPIYYAPIGDSTAFFLGAAVLWAYIARRPAAMVAGFGLALFCWPALFLLLPLLLWPRSDTPPASASEVRPLSPAAGRLVQGLALPAGLGLLAVIALAVAMPGLADMSKEGALALTSNGLTLGAAAGFFVALALANARLLRASPSWFGVWAAGSVLSVGVLYVRAFESGSLAFSGVTFFREVLLFARSAPFVALAGHVSYYSGLAAAAMALWPRVLMEGLRMGPGAFVSLGLCGLMAGDAESRRLNAYWPLVGFFAVAALEKLWPRRANLVVFCLALLALSKLWWPLTGPPLFSAAHDPGNYFNTQGPSMSMDALWAHALAGIVLGYWTWRTAAGPRLPARIERE